MNITILNSTLIGTFSVLLLLSGCAHKPKSLRRTPQEKFVATIKRMSLPTTRIRLEKNILTWDKLSQKSVATSSDGTMIGAYLTGYALFFFEPHGCIPKKPTCVIPITQNRYHILKKQYGSCCVLKPCYSVAGAQMYGPASILCLC